MRSHNTSAQQQGRCLDAGMTGAFQLNTIELPGFSLAYFGEQGTKRVGKIKK